ncbi:hypothetical protein EDB84DRAFT_1675132 [Lactarius hengduanensis]|nr:hypothetical protein EDB84DRAFT_1675132 [Lactarius hengduanensis]
MSGIWRVETEQQGSESLLIQYMHSLFWYRPHEVVILVVGMEMDQEYDEGNICSAFFETTPESHRFDQGFDVRIENPSASGALAGARVLFLEKHCCWYWNTMADGTGVAWAKRGKR